MFGNVSLTLIGLFRMSQFSGEAPSFYGESVGGLSMVPFPYL